MTSELQMREEQAGGEVCLFISGEVDIYTSQKLKERLYRIIDGQQSDIRVDLSGLNYIDSTGLGVFVGALKKSRLSGRNISLKGLKGNIKKLFVITGLDKLFLIEE